MRSDVNKGITVLYFISWIFIGNFILLNLFLAILLDSFLEEDEEEGEKEKEEEEKQKDKAKAEAAKKAKS